ncbi:MAG: type I 3-dehydroquinate dehydratase, partial [Planctomycetota bacterium]
METKLIVPIAARKLEDARAQIKAAVAAGADMVELRVDYLKNLNSALVEGLMGQTRKAAGQAVAIVVTCRDKQQGGVIDYQEQLRIEVLASALRAGADFVDLEHENFLSPANQETILLALSENTKARLVLSAHNFETRFDDIGKLYSGIPAAHEEAVPKLVYTANHINDCFEAFDLLHNTTGERIALCMGEVGLISRVLARKLGCFYTFASIDDRTATAPGQLTIEQLKKLYRFDCINAETDVYGVIGSPIAHSLSPPIHNAAFADAGLNKLYLPLLVEGGRTEFDRFMDNILARDWLGFRGLSVTIPHKQNAVDYVMRNGGFVEPLAERIRAVNTVLIAPDGKL